MEEIWKDIPGYEGVYQVSNIGRVQSLDRFYKKGSDKVLRFYKGKILKYGFSNGYHYAYLRNGKKKAKRATVHSLVMLCFVSRRPLGYTINHKDLNRSNNILSNLEYATHQENTKHAWDKRGGWKLYHGSENKMAKLSEKDVIEIRRLYGQSKMYGKYRRGNMTFQELSDRFNVSFGYIRNIVYKTNWKHLIDGGASSVRL